MTPYLHPSQLTSVLARAASDGESAIAQLEAGSRHRRFIARTRSRVDTASTACRHGLVHVHDESFDCAERLLGAASIPTAAGRLAPG
jgi:hypothetical protein